MMCNLPLYEEVKGNPAFNNRMILPHTAHAGLWYDKFFNQFDDNWKVIEPNKTRREDGGKVNWINSVVGTVGNKDLIEKYADRTKSLVEALGGCVMDLRSEWNFVTGLGLSHPVENGFAWHRTLGVPYLTGAAVKGMLRAYVEVWTDMKEADKKAQLKSWFGDTDGAGGLMFFDAVPTGQVELIRDVMTNHMGKWYEDGGSGKYDDGSNVPADWHDPNPIPFLAVAPKQTFRFAFARRPGKGRDIVLADVAEALAEALEWIGAGAKTAVGYGRFTPECLLDTKKPEEAVDLSRLKDFNNREARMGGGRDKARKGR